jgi:hypothetical protein
LQEGGEFGPALQAALAAAMPCGAAYEPKEDRVSITGWFDIYPKPTMPLRWLMEEVRGAVGRQKRQTWAAQSGGGVAPVPCSPIGSRSGVSFDELALMCRTNRMEYSRLTKDPCYYHTLDCVMRRKKMCEMTCCGVEGERIAADAAEVRTAGWPNAGSDPGNTIIIEARDGDKPLDDLTAAQVAHLSHGTASNFGITIARAPGSRFRFAHAESGASMLKPGILTVMEAYATAQHMFQCIEGSE